LLLHKGSKQARNDLLATSYYLRPDPPTTRMRLPRKFSKEMSNANVLVDTTHTSMSRSGINSCSSGRADTKRARTVLVKNTVTILRLVAWLLASAIRNDETDRAPRDQDCVAPLCFSQRSADRLFAHLIHQQQELTNKDKSIVAPYCCRKHPRSTERRRKEGTAYIRPVEDTGRRGNLDLLHPSASL